MNVLYGNDYSGNEIREWQFRRETEKRVFVGYTADTRRDDVFAKDAPRLPEGAIAAKDGVSGRIFLFRSRAACIRYMMDRAAKSADSKRRAAEELDREAIEWAKKLIEEAAT